MNTKYLFKFVTALSFSSLAGCTMAQGGASDVESVPETVGQTSDAVVVRDPNSSYFADVQANGTGCPAGTWTVDLSPDGKTFTLAFSAYEASINPSQPFSTKDCQIAIKLHSPQGLSFAVSDFYYSGYAFLDSPGMQGQQSAKYYFQGNPVDNAKGRTAIRGPFSNEYTFQDKVGIADLVWSKCGVERSLNIDSRILLQNNPRRTGTGYINTSSVNGEIRLTFRLAWKRC